MRKENPRHIFAVFRRFFLLALTLPLAAGCGSPEQQEARYVRSGNSLFDRGQYEKARVEYKNAARVKPLDAEPLYRIGLVDEAEGNLRNAYRDFLSAEQQDRHFLPAKLKVAQYLLAGEQLAAAGERIHAVLNEAPRNAEARALSASLLIRSKRLDEAETEALLALQLDRASLDGAAALTGVYAAGNQTDKALAAVNDGLKQHPGNLALLTLRALVYAKTGDVPGIAATYDEIFKQDTGNIQFRADLAGVYIKAGKIDEAEAVWRAAVAARPDDWNMKHELALFLGAHRGADAAEQDIRSLMSAHPDRDELYFWLAGIDLDHDQADRAIDLLTPLAQRASSPASALKAKATLARIYAQRGDAEQAKTLANQVLAAAPGNPDALLVSAGLAFNAGDYPVAVAKLHSVLRGDAASRTALRLLAETLLRQKRYDLAIDTQERLIDAAPGDIDAHIRLAQMMQLNGDGGKAVALIGQTVRQSPGNAIAWESAARLATDAKQWLLADQAIATLDAIDGQHLTALFLKGDVLQANGRNEEAMAAFAAVADANPATPLGHRALQALAALYGSANRMQAACDYFESLKTDDAFVATLLGQCYGATGRTADSVRAFDRAIAAKPAFQDPYLDRAALYLGAGKTDDAIAVLKQAEAAAPDDDRAAMMTAGLLTTPEHYREAASLYDVLLARDPDNIKAANNLAELIADYEDGDAAALGRAREIAERFTGASDPVLLDTLAWVYFRQGNLRMAESTIERALSLAGGSVVPQMHYHYGSILMKVGKVAKGKDELRAATREGASYPGREAAQSLLSDQ